MLDLLDTTTKKKEKHSKRKLVHVTISRTSKSFFLYAYFCWVLVSSQYN